MNHPPDLISYPQSGSDIKMQCWMISQIKLTLGSQDLGASTHKHVKIFFCGNTYMHVCLYGMLGRG